MPIGLRKCKVCGKLYEYCKTNRSSDIFRWQDVACSPSHGSIYLARITESRSVSISNDTTPKAVDEIDAYEDDELFEEDFDDSDEEPAIETK